MSKPPPPLFCENAEEKLGQFLKEKRQSQALKDASSDDDNSALRLEDLKRAAYYLRREISRLEEKVKHQKITY